jgi:hypothetical protein
MVPQSLGETNKHIERMEQLGSNSTMEQRYFHERCCVRIYEEIMGEAIEPFHCGRLPDVVGALHMCSFFKDDRLQLPVVHVLSKALPQRCQYRNLKEVCIKYCRENASFSLWLRMITLASLGGYYPHNSVMVPLQRRLELYVGFYHTSDDAWVRWLENNGYLLFYILKELLVYICPFDPALSECIEATYEWDMFQTICIRAMNTVRNIWVLAVPNKCQHIESELLKANAVQLKYLYKVPSVPFSTILYQGLTHTRQRMYETLFGTVEDIRSTLMVPTDVGNMVRTIIQHQHLLPEIRHEQWLALLGVTNTTPWQNVENAFRHQALQIKGVVKELGVLSPPDLAIYNEYGCRLYDLRSIQIHRLPSHWVQSHWNSLRSKAHSGVFYICRACKHFKAFVVKQNKKDVNFFALGHDKVLYDDETDRVYCARRSTKNNAPPKRKKSSGWKGRNQKVVRNQRARLKRRSDEHEECRHSELVPVFLCGKLLQCYDKLYTLCMQPGCARPCQFHFYKTQHRFSCGRCTLQEQQERRCGYCGAACTDRTKIVLHHHGMVVTILLCPRHAFGSIVHSARKEWTRKDLWKTIRKCMRKKYG